VLKQATQDRQVTIRGAEPGDLSTVREFMLEIIDKDFGYRYQPQWHWDLDALAEVYLEHPRHSLVVAMEAERLVGTAALRSDGLRTPPHPEWLSTRYAGPDAGQLVRVFIAADRRRRGIGRALVAPVLEQAFTRVGYRTVFLHTSADVPGAESFWRSLGPTLVYDEREHGTGHYVHFEFAAP